MSIFQLAVLLVAGFFAGVVNSVAGGGSLFIYPLLLSLGILPVTANATFSFAVFPGQVSSAIGYKRYIKKLPQRYYSLVIPAVLGGIVGAFFLGLTSNRTFEYIVPWFMVLATILLILQPRIHKWLYTHQAKNLERQYHGALFAFIFLFMFVLSVYGGYFGAGFGIVMLAFLGLSELTNIHQMNGLKNVIAICIGIATGAYFIHIGLIAWSVLPCLLIGNAFGGWFGATYSSKLPVKVIRGIIIAIGVIISAILFTQQYLHLR